ncbi:MAG TPA: DUF4139 domain-containing protein [Flavobacterium sp.]|jgi:uncharacterized protein (TIGR02231 family)
MRKFILSIFVLTASISLAQKPVFTTAKVKSATVYFNAAELSSTASVNLPAGTSEIVIKNVANNLNESTVRIGAPSTLTVMSVQFTNNYISEYDIDENSPAIRKVRDSIRIVQKDINKIQIEKVSLSKTVDLLDQNRQVSGINTGLSVAELIKMVDYYKVQRTQLNYAITNLQEKETALSEILDRLNSKLEIDTNKEEKLSSGKLILQVMNDVAGNVPLDLSYITNAASWRPFYDLRADNITSPINMLYKAQVAQNTGVDWRKVKLALSSGTPNQNNQAPILHAWFLQYGRADQGYIDDAAVLNSIQGRVAGLEVKKEASYVAANVSPHTTIVENQLSVTFDIDIPYDILSNGKTHSVSLKDIKLPASYHYYAAPIVEKEAFLLARISEYSKYNLLPGEANIIFEGMYVGKTMINPNQTSDTLNLSMGRDKKISITREKVVDKSGTKFLSAYKEQTFTYDITIRNNKKEGVELMLKDQYPLSPDKEITIELLQSDKAKVNAETGILTWDLKLAANETKKIRISYKVRYPKDRIINNL